MYIFLWADIELQNLFLQNFVFDEKSENLYYKNLEPYGA